MGDLVHTFPALTEAAQGWYRQDEEAASAWLETSGLSAEAVEEVTSPPRRGGDFMDAFRRFGRDR